MQLLIIKTDDEHKGRKPHEKKISLPNIRRRTITFGGKGSAVEVEKGHDAYQKNNQHQHHIEMFKQASVYSKHYITPLMAS
jgi:hypothetical protein